MIERARVDALLDKPLDIAALREAGIAAEAFHQADWLVREVLDSVLSQIFGRDVTFTRATFDDYDDSMELYNFEPYDIDPTPEQLAMICELGFDLMWIHRGERRTYPASDERLFSTRRGK